MYPLALTMLFLSLLGILTSTEIKNYTTQVVKHQIFETYIAANHQMQRAQERARFQEAAPEVTNNTTDENKGQKKPPTPKISHHGDCDESDSQKNSFSQSEKHPLPLNINLGRPPNNSRFNFALVLSDHKVNKWDEKFSPYHLAKRLMILLYSDQPFFQNISNVADLILSKLIEKKEQTEKFTHPDQLATLSLDNEDLQVIFYRMLKGDHGCPSLLNYLTFDLSKNKWTANHHKINLMYANKTLINLIIENENATDSLLEMRGEMWKKILKQEEIRLTMTREEGLNRTKIKQHLKQSFYNLIESYGLDAKELEKHFDFGLGHPGNTLLVRDEQTGIMIREKI
ncbi:MAG: hypothetical protein KDK55_01715 [Chlamydiia bacterium]|nr:hypothetical protein [Chlamydiia bacterium]